MSDRRWVRGALVVGVAAAAGLALLFSPLGSRLVDAPALIAELRGYNDRWWVVPLYVAAYAVLNILFIPTQALSIAGVLLWGWQKAGIIELFSATIGALFPYLIARSTLRDWVASRLSQHGRVRAALERDSFTLLLLLRVVPIIPYTALNYVAGLSPIRPQRYLLATFIGMVPSTFIFAYFVDATVEGVMSPREVMIRAIAAGLLFAALIIATRLAAPRVQRKLSSTRTSPPPAGADRD